MKMTFFRNLALVMIALLPVAFDLHAQTTAYGDFRIEANQLVFQKIVERDSVTLEQLEQFFASQPAVSNVQRNGEVLTAAVTDLTVDYRKFSFTQVATPPIMQTGRFSGKLTAQVKDGRYRVMLDDLTMHGDIGYKKIPTPEKVTNYACINSGTQLSRDWCRPNMLGLLGSAFSDCLVMPARQPASDW